MIRAPAIVAALVRLGPAFVIFLAALGSTPAAAQSSSSLFSASPSVGMISPGADARGDIFSPNGGALAPSTQTPLIAPGTPALAVAPMPMVPAGQVALALSARFGKDAPIIDGGLTWRVYSARPEAGGNFRLIKEDKSPAPTLVLPAGNYIVHVGFGLATAVKPVALRGQTVHEDFDLPAGGLRMEGRVGDVRVPAGQISFDVYKGSQFEAGDRRPIAEHVMTGDVVIVPEGT